MTALAAHSIIGKMLSGAVTASTTNHTQENILPESSRGLTVCASITITQKYMQTRIIVAGGKEKKNDY